MVIFNDTQSPSVEELAHHGVKGMHWGQRKAQDLVPSGKQLKTAVNTTGRVLGNATVSTAKKTYKVGSWVLHHKRLVLGAAVTADILAHGASGSIMAKAMTNRQAAYEAGKIATKALSSTASKIDYAKLVKGAYKITTL